MKKSGLRCLFFRFPAPVGELFCEAFRPRMMLFEAVENFTVRDVTLQDAAFWTLHMAGCRHVRIQNIMILNDDRGANNDGIDPDCCRDVVISNCIVRTGDGSLVNEIIEEGFHAVKEDKAE